MVRGTRHLLGIKTKRFRQITEILRNTVISAGYEEFIPSLLAEQEVFIEKAGKEVLGQMYVFKDKGNRDICLIPEVTAIIQKLYKEEWSKSFPKPIKLFYLTKCFRYEKPQSGRYREFWQFGIELLGGKIIEDEREVRKLLQDCLFALGLKKFRVINKVKRGLQYYVEDGFEIEWDSLGAQKQIAGGGRYDGGIGWAIGIDRLMLCK